MPLPKKRRLSLFKLTAKWLDAGSDLLNSLVPIVVLLLGIGLINVLPKNVTKPLFNSIDDREKFFTTQGGTFDPEIPLILTSTNCSKCNQLAADLEAAQVPYAVKIWDEDTFGREIAKQAIKITGDKEPPWVVLGIDLVDVDLDSVKLAYSRTK